MDIKDNLRSLKKSFSHAGRGIKYCIANERNMRIHISAMCIVLSFAHTYKATKVEYIALLFCIGLVISCEMINTSIETIINLSSPAYNNLAKITKDVAAGAVLVTTIMAVIIGGIIFLDITRLQSSIAYIIDNTIIIFYYLALILACLGFILKYPTIYHTQKTNKKKGKFKNDK